MSEPRRETVGCLDYQEFIDEGPNDPAILAKLTADARRRRRRFPWRVIALAAVPVAALVVGVFLGRLWH
jgi:hypothetical protein